MKISVGLDLCDVDRVGKKLEREGFAKRILGPDEYAWYEEKGFPPERVAAAFAAKEAFSKALGTGVRGFALAEVQVLHDELGRPYYAFSGAAKELVDARGLSFELSLTHTKTTAAAVAVAYGAEETE